MTIVRLLLTMHALLRIHPNERLLHRVLSPGWGSAVLLLILRLLLHPSISAAEPVPVGWTGSARAIKTAGKDN